MIATVTFGMLVLQDQFLGGKLDEFTGFLFHKSSGKSVVAVEDFVNGLGPFELTFVPGPSTTDVVMVPSQSSLFRIDYSGTCFRVVPKLFPAHMIQTGSVRQNSDRGAVQNRSAVLFGDPSKTGVNEYVSSGPVTLQEIDSCSSPKFKFGFSPAFSECKLRLRGPVSATELLPSAAMVLGGVVKKSGSGSRIEIDPPKFRRIIAETLRFRTRMRLPEDNRARVRYALVTSISDSDLVHCWEVKDKYLQRPISNYSITNKSIQQIYDQVLSTVDPEVREKSSPLDFDRPIYVLMGYRLDVRFLAFTKAGYSTDF